MSEVLVELFLSVSPQEDEWYEQSSDARSQLKFFEQLERMEKQRKDEREREILLRAAKVISHVNAGEALHLAENWTNK